MDTRIEILIDLSNSMGSMSGTPDQGKYLLPNGSTRMTLQKKILLDEILPTIDYAKRITIRTFHSRDSKLVAPIIYDGPFSLNSLKNAIFKLPSDPQKTGGTPITDAITLSIQELSKDRVADSKIILITDGGENGTGNYIEKSKEALDKYNIQCKIFIVGIAQDSIQESKTRDLTTLTNGAYLNLKSTQYDSNYVKAQLISLRTAIIHDSIDSANKLRTTDNIIKEKHEHNLEKKLVQIQNESDKALFLSKIEELGLKLQNQIETSQTLLSDILILKAKIENFNFQSIDSTTLTIDSDYSEEIRMKSEAFAYNRLLEKYPNKKVKWLNSNGESYANHDFEIQNESNEIELFVECKGTPLRKKTFYLTDYEWDFFLETKDNYQIIRVYNLNEKIDYIIIDNLFESLKKGEVVPYLLAPELLNERRVFLTLVE
jgi:hypothetical protein